MSWSTTTVALVRQSGGSIALPSAPTTQVGLGFGNDVLKAPVDALTGVSEGDAKLLKEAFNIKTVQDSGKDEYFRAAHLLTQLAEAGAK